MNLHHKIKLFLILTLVVLNSCLSIQALGGDRGTERSLNATFVFVIDVSSSMSPRMQTAGLTVADMIERGISGKLKDGDTIHLWTYTDRLNTNIMPALKWVATDARHISNLVFLKIKNLSATKNYAVPIDVNRVLTAGNLSNVTIYIVTDGNRKVQGIPIEEEISNVFLFNKDRWKKERFMCIIGLDFRNKVLVNWAVGEADILSSIKTIAKMPEPSVEKPKAEDKGVKVENVTEPIKKTGVTNSVATTEKPKVYTEPVAEVKNIGIITNKPDLKQQEKTTPPGIESTNKMESHNKDKTEVVKYEKFHTETNNITVRPDVPVVDKNLKIKVTKEPQTNQVIQVTQKENAGNIVMTVTDTPGRTATFNSIKVSVPEVLNATNTIKLTNQGSAKVDNTNLSENVDRKPDDRQKKDNKKPDEPVKQVATANVVAEERVKVAASQSNADVKVVTNFGNNKMDVTGQVDSGKVGEMPASGVSNIESASTESRNGAKLDSHSSNEVAKAEHVAMAHDSSTDWLLIIAIVLAVTAMVLWVIAVRNLKPDSTRHSLITKGYSKKNLIKK